MSGARKIKAVLLDDNADLASALKHVRMSFDHVVTSEDCRAYKPRPEPFQRALRLLGLEAHEVLHVGDSGQRRRGRGEGDGHAGPMDQSQGPPRPRRIGGAGLHRGRPGRVGRGHTGTRRR